MNQVPDDMLDQIIQGDCLEVIKRLPDGLISAVITDPPYGIRLRSHGMLFKGTAPIQNDDSIAAAQAVEEWANGITVAMFYSPYRPMVFGWRSILVWDKGAHVGIGGDRKTCWKRDAELIGIKGNRPLNGKRDSCVLRYNALLPPPSGHPAEKPVDLMEYLIHKLTNPGDIILDPFCGSGTTCVAAKRLGRHYIGIELDETYCRKARARLRGTEAPLFGGQAT